jgi:hypothetical protein
MGTLANAIGVLGVLSTTLEAVPVVGSNLKIAADLASKICETVQVCHCSAGPAACLICVLDTENQR